jgi:hypothetical protein
MLMKMTTIERLAELLLLASTGSLLALLMLLFAGALAMMTQVDDNRQAA